MERLAKEKIAAQNRILSLKREFPQWDIDFSKLLAEQTDVNAVKSERTGIQSNKKFYKLLLNFPSWWNRNTEWYNGTYKSRLQLCKFTF